MNSRIGAVALRGCFVLLSLVWVAVFATLYNWGRGGVYHLLGGREKMPGIKAVSSPWEEVLLPAGATGWEWVGSLKVIENPGPEAGKASTSPARDLAPAPGAVSSEWFGDIPGLVLLRRKKGPVGAVEAELLASFRLRSSGELIELLQGRIPCKIGNKSGDRWRMVCNGSSIECFWRNPVQSGAEGNGRVTGWLLVTRLHGRGGSE